MPLNDEEKAQLQTLLEKLAPSDDLSGLKMVPTEVLTGRLKDKDRRIQSLQAEADARLAEIQRERDEAAASLRKLQDKGKSVEELFAEKLREAEERAATQAARAEELDARHKVAVMKQRLEDLIYESGRKPVRLSTAIREAIAELAPSVVDDSGDLALQVRIDGQVAPSTPEAVKAWWNTRTDLHEAPGTQMTSPGAGKPPGPAPRPDVLKDKAPGYAQFSAALAADPPPMVPMIPEGKE